MNKKVKHSLINIGTGKEYSIKQYVNIFLKVLIPNRKIRIIYDKSKPNGVPRKVMDIKIAKKYGWKYKTNLRNAILNTYKDYARKHQKS